MPRKDFEFYVFFTKIWFLKIFRILRFFLQKYDFWEYFEFFRFLSEKNYSFFANICNFLFFKEKNDCCKYFSFFLNDFCFNFFVFFNKNCFFLNSNFSFFLKQFLELVFLDFCSKIVFFVFKLRKKSISNFLELIFFSKSFEIFEKGTFPLLVFFSFFYYTDSGSLGMVLLYLISTFRHSPFFSIIFAISALFFRQTNIIWIFFASTISILYQKNQLGKVVRNVDKENFQKREFFYEIFFENFFWKIFLADFLEGILGDFMTDFWREILVKNQNFGRKLNFW